MADKKSLKTALLLSILMLAICVASMIGSTYAWFTDSVTAERNQIKVGNLDVDLQFSHDGETWHTVQNGTRLFDEGEQMTPGSSQMVFLRIQNEGSLHLKYQLSMNIVEEIGSTNVRDQEFLMSQHIKVGVLDRSEMEAMMTAQGSAMSLKQVMTSYEAAPQTFAKTQADTIFRNAANVLLKTEDGTTAQPPQKLLQESALAPDDAHVFALIVYTPSELDEEINHKKGYNPPKIKFGIDVVAGQRSGSQAESDSFGNDYDQHANYPGTISQDIKDGKLPWPFSEPGGQPGTEPQP